MISDLPCSFRIFRYPVGALQIHSPFFNFCSLLRYNPSFKYALGVSLLSDAIGGIED